MKYISFVMMSLGLLAGCSSTSDAWLDHQLTASTSSIQATGLSQPLETVSLPPISPGRILVPFQRRWKVYASLRDKAARSSKSS